MSMSSSNVFLLPGAGLIRQTYRDEATVEPRHSARACCSLQHCQSCAQLQWQKRRGRTGSNLAPYSTRTPLVWPLRKAPVHQGVPNSYRVSLTRCRAPNAAKADADTPPAASSTVRDEEVLLHTANGIVKPGVSRIFISTGDVSGDMHAAGLVRQLWTQSRAMGQELSICALGGGTIEEAGVTLVGDNRGLSSIGLLEALPLVIPTLRLQAKVRAFLREHPPDMVILVDYPGVNIPFGRYLKNHFGCPVVYYVPPNEWLWNQSRTPALCAISDVVLCNYAREAEYFRNGGGSIELVGHPLLDAVAAKPGRAAARAQLGVGDGTLVLALLPASRPQELRHVWPVIARAAEMVQQQWGSAESPPLRFFIPVLPGDLAEQLEALLRSSPLAATLWKGDSHVVLAAADVAITKSGTVNLELALFQVPQVVVYRIDAVTAWLARTVFNFAVPHISLVNLILEEPLVPEFIQEAADADAVAAATLRLLRDEGNARGRILHGYRRLNDRLGGAGAARRAAATILKRMAQRTSSTLDDVGD